MNSSSELSNVERMQILVLNLAARVAQGAPTEELLGMIADILDRCHEIEEAGRGK